MRFSILSSSNLLASPPSDAFQNPLLRPLNICQQSSNLKHKSMINLQNNLNFQLNFQFFKLIYILPVYARQNIF
ncbi:hypothetical protein CISIN_1g035113mg [Citrus sinensis]|uniref:Uncharacterized protein n=1 Tax=Citrus sinensis TaxID=2711 RepID=A0A067DNM4_CITSI|nr:hypothetical protein CISIN_1g035113mg [Citrus sinensis]